MLSLLSIYSRLAGQGTEDELFARRQTHTQCDIRRQTLSRSRYSQLIASFSRLCARHDYGFCIATIAIEARFAAFGREESRLIACDFHTGCQGYTAKQQVYCYLTCCNVHDSLSVATLLISVLSMVQ